MKVFKYSYSNVLAISLVTAMSLVACGRAELKTLKKTTPKDLEISKLETDILSKNPTSDRTWKDENDDAFHIEAVSQEELTQEKTKTEVSQAEKDFAFQIKNLDLREDNKNKSVNVTLAIDLDNTISQNINVFGNDDLINLNPSPNFKQFKFEGLKENIPVTQGLITVVLTQKSLENHYTLRIKNDSTKTEVLAFIRINGTHGEISQEESRLTQDQTISKLFQAGDLKLKTTISQIYSTAYGPGQGQQDGVFRFPLKSGANKIKVWGQSVQHDTRFLIKGFASDIQSKARPATLIAAKNSEDTTQETVGPNSILRELGLSFNSEAGVGAVALYDYKEIDRFSVDSQVTTKNREILKNNSENLRAIDADLLKLTLSFKDQKSQDNFLSLHLKFDSYNNAQAFLGQLTSEAGAIVDNVLNGGESEDASVKGQDETIHSDDFQDSAPTEDSVAKLPESIDVYIQKENGKMVTADFAFQITVKKDEAFTSYVKLPKGATSYEIFDASSDKWITISQKDGWRKGFEYSDKSMSGFIFIAYKNPANSYSVGTHINKFRFGKAEKTVFFKVTE